MAQINIVPRLRNSGPNAAKYYYYNTKYHRRYSFKIHNAALIYTIIMALRAINKKWRMGTLQGEKEESE